MRGTESQSVREREREGQRVSQSVREREREREMFYIISILALNDRCIPHPHLNSVDIEVFLVPSRAHHIHMEDIAVSAPPPHLPPRLMVRCTALLSFETQSFSMTLHYTTLWSLAPHF